MIELAKETEVKIPRNYSDEISYANSPLFEELEFLPYNPDELYQKRGDYSLFDKMRQDDQISACLTLKKMIILNAPYVIETENDDIKEFIDFALNNMDDIFTKKLYEILTAMDYGFSITEKILDYVETPFGKKIIFTKLKTRAPHSWEILQDDFGNVEKLRQNGPSGYLDFDPKKFILYSYNKEFDNPFGKSELNAGVYRAYWSKDAIIKFWNIYLERFGMPTIIGKMPKSAGVSDRERFLKALKNIQAKTAITIPDDFFTELLEVSSGAGEYESAINKYDTMIARRMLIPDLLGMSGSKTSGGSYSLGKEQFNIFYTVISYIRRDIEKIVNREIIKPLIHFNFGSKEDAVFKFQAVDEERKENDLRMWMEAVKDGKVPVTDDSINWFLKSINAPEVDQEELDKMREEKEAFKDQLTKNKNTEEPEAETDEENNEEIEKPEKEKKDFEKSGYYRQLTEYEKKVNFKQIENKISEIDIEYIVKLGELFKLAINGLVDDIKRKRIVEKKRIELINTISMRHQSKCESIFKSMIKDAFRYGKVTTNKKEFAIAETGKQLESEAELVKWFEEYASYVASSEYGWILGKVKPILLESIRSGSSTKEAIKMINDVLSGYDISYIYDTYKDKTTGEIIKQVPVDIKSKKGAFRLETIVRTTTNKAFNESRLREFKELESAGEIVAYQYSAIMDGRTSAICSALDEKIIKPSEVEKYNPPNHYNCRSLLVPVFVDEDFNGEFSTLPKTTQEGDFLKMEK